MDISIKDGISSFVIHCRIKNLDPKSIHFYKVHLDNFIEFLEMKQKDLSIIKIDTSILREFILYLQNEKQMRNKKLKGYSSVGINRHIKVLKIFFKFLQKEGIIENNPSRNIPRQRVENKIIETFSDVQIKRMLEIAKSKKNFSGLRDYLVIHLLYDTGARISELLNLKNQDIDFDRRVFYVVGKGNKKRDVPFGRVSYELLCLYLRKRDDLFGKTEYLLLASNGKVFSRRQAAKNLERIGKIAGIQGVRVSPHTFRHTFAKNYLLNGGDVFSLKEILGHNDLETVQIYVNMNQRDIISQYNKYNPGDKLLASQIQLP